MEILKLFYLLCLTITTLKSIQLSLKYSLQAQNFLTIYLSITLVLESFGTYKGYIKEYDFAFLFNLYALFCIAFFGFYFYRSFLLTPKLIEAFATVLFLIIGLFFIDYSGKEFPVKLGILIVFFYIFNAMLWFYQKLKLPVKNKITNDPNFWIATALLLWSTYMIFRFTPMYLFHKEDQFFLDLLIKISSIVNIMMYILFLIGILKYENEIKNKIAKNINVNGIKI